MAAPAKTVVLGIGNLLRGDDGAGVRVVQALERRGTPDGVELVDGGTGGPTLLVHFEDADALIIVDAVNLGAAPGTVRVFSLAEIEQAEEPARLSLHEVGILPMLHLARSLDRLPRTVRIVGIQPVQLDLGDRLSPAVEAAVPEAAGAVLAELADLQSC